MALQRRKNQKTQYRRAASGQGENKRRRGGDFYDLREQEQERNPAEYQEAPAADERPYRERHRVEVQPVDSRRRVVRGNVPGANRNTPFPGRIPDETPPRTGDREISADMFMQQRPGGNRNGSTSGRQDSRRGNSLQPAGDLTRTGNPPRRRAATSIPTGYRRQEPTPGRIVTGSRQQEPAPGRTATGSRGQRGAAPRPEESWRQRYTPRPTGAQRQNTVVPRWEDSRRQGYSVPVQTEPRGDRFNTQRTGPVREQTISRRTGPVREQTVSRRTGPVREQTISRRTEPVREEFTNQPDDPVQRRARREQLRREREKQLHRTWIRTGAIAAASLLILILVIRIAVGLRHKESPEPAAGTVAVETGAQTETGEDTANPTQEGAPPDEMSSDTGENDVLTGAEPEKETQEDTGNGEEKPETPTETSDQAERSSDPEETAEADDAADSNAVQSVDTVPGTEETAEKTGTEETAEKTETEETAQKTETEENAANSTQSYSNQDDWKLILVNPWHKLPEGYTIETTSLLNGESVDSRCFQALTDMLEDCRTAGGSPIVCSSYRPHEKQVALFEEQVKALMAEGLDREAAEKEAGTAVAVPGTSEHELGLAVDICDSENQLLDTSQEQTLTQQWLMNNCWYYGFILRYPKDKTDLTGIIYEPWHYRYVGTEAAAQIQERGICLEEYLSETAP